MNERPGTGVRVVSYNLREHKARGEIQTLAERHDVDVLCLQEADTDDLPSSFGDFALAGATRRNRLGLATYCRRNRFEVVATEAYKLQKSVHDRVMSPAHQRLLGVHLRDRITGQGLLVGSFHAAPLTASNALRRRQVDLAHDRLRALSPGAPMLMVGDYNYPWFVGGLRRRIARQGFALTRSNTHTYLGYKIVRGHFDFATSHGLQIRDIVTLPAGASDHRPILVCAQDPAARETALSTSFA